MTKLLGANWQTTLWGSISSLSIAIAATPALVAFLPDQIENWVRGFAGLVAAVSGVKFALEAKSKNVTGGVVAQTSDGSVAVAPSSSVLETKQAEPKP